IATRRTGAGACQRVSVPARRESAFLGTSRIAEMKSRSFMGGRSVPAAARGGSVRDLRRRIRGARPRFGVRRGTSMAAPRNLRPKATLVVRNATLATCDRGLSDAGIVPGGAVAVDERRIVWVG